MKLRELEDAMNELCDSNSEWWPFQFLRPAPEKRLGVARALALAILNGVPLGLAITLLISLRVPAIHPAFFPAIMTLSFFAVYQATIAVFWNRRAVRLALARSHSRRG
jgi:hypothetical protein